MGFVTDNPSLNETTIDGYDVIGKVENIPDIIKEKVVDEIVFAVSKMRLEEFEELFLLCEEQGINTRIIINFFPHMRAKIHLEDLYGVPSLTFVTTPYNEFSLVLKRGFALAVTSISGFGEEQRLKILGSDPSEILRVRSTVTLWSTLRRRVTGGTLTPLAQGHVMTRENDALRLSFSITTVKTGLT